MSTPAEFSLRRVVGLLVLTVGLFVASYPFVSVWRLGGEVLSMLPEGTEQFNDDRSAGALFDSDFVLATRSYSQASVEEIETALVEAGFDEQYRNGEDVWHWKTCCGAYDAALARVGTDASGMVVVEMSVFDSDIQLTWWFLSGMGALLVFAGVFIAFANGLKSDAMPVAERDQQSIGGSQPRS